MRDTTRTFVQKMMLIILLFASGVPALASTNNNSATTCALTILHTNDLHGQILPLTVNGQSIGGFARQATLIKQVRKETNDRVLLLFAGDLFSRGDGLVNRDGGAGAMRLLDRMGYDAMTPGNGDFYFGVDNLLATARQVSFPLVLANIVDKTTSKPLVKPYVIEEVAGLRVAIIGVGSIHEEHPSCVGLKTLNPIETAAKLANELRDQVDVVVVLSHIGVIFDPMIATKDLGHRRHRRRAHAHASYDSYASRLAGRKRNHDHRSGRATWGATWDASICD